MSGPELGLAVSVFLACAVEAVEALTIVMAVGVTRSWSSALSGVAAAAATLAVLIAALGPALDAIPIDALRLVVGGLLLVFGLQWLRKAVLLAGLAAHGPLARVPENIMKFTVGVMLTSFGTFWGAEGAGASWPGGDAALPGVIAVVVLASIGLVLWLRRTPAAATIGEPA